jgi:hypothetical protein
MAFISGEILGTRKVGYTAQISSHREKKEQAAELSEAQRTQTTAQKVFRDVEYASGQKGQYTLLDHFYFNVIEPIVSLFTSSPTTEMQKALYKTNCKVNAAYEKYSTRKTDLQKTFVDNKQKDPRTHEYYDHSLRRDLNTVSKLQECIQFIENDAEIKKSRLIMAKGYLEQREAVEKYATANGLNEQEKAKLLTKVQPTFSRELSEIRKGIAIDLINKYGLVEFVAQFENIVGILVKKGLGAEDKVRDDLVSFAATYVNNTDSQETLMQYFDAFSISLGTRIGPVGSTIQKYFQNSLQGMINGDEVITAEMLQKVMYEEGKFQYRPIYLSEFVSDLGHDLGHYATLLEDIRVTTKAYKAAIEQVNPYELAFDREDQLLNELNKMFEEPTRKVSTADLAILMVKYPGVEEALKGIIPTAGVQEIKQVLENKVQLEQRIAAYGNTIAHLESQHKAIVVPSSGKTKEELQKKQELERNKFEIGQDIERNYHAKQQLTIELATLSEQFSQSCVQFSQKQLVTIGERLGDINAIGAENVLAQQIIAAKKTAEQIDNQEMNKEKASEALIAQSEVQEAARQALYTALEDAHLLYTEPHAIENDAREISTSAEPRLLSDLGTVLVGQLTSSEHVQYVADLHRLSLERGQLMAAANIIVAAEQQFKTRKLEKAKSKGLLAHTEQLYAEQSEYERKANDAIAVYNLHIGSKLTPEQEIQLQGVFPSEFFLEISGLYQSMAQMKPANVGDTVVVERDQPFRAVFEAVNYNNADEVNTLDEVTRRPVSQDEQQFFTLVNDINANGLTPTVASNSDFRLYVDETKTVNNVINPKGISGVNRPSMRMNLDGTYEDDEESSASTEYSEEANEVVTTDDQEGFFDAASDYETEESINKVAKESKRKSWLETFNLFDY